MLDAGTAPGKVMDKAMMKRLLDLGITDAAAQNALSMLASGGAVEVPLDDRVELLLDLTRACGSLQNAKLAYSLALRSEEELNPTTVGLLTSALRHCDCVPAAVRLWKAAVGARVSTAEDLVTAARLGENGAEQIRILSLLKEQPEKASQAAALSRRLSAPGWHAEGSWGTYFDEQRGTVWWDYARPAQRRTFGMTLACDPVELKQRLGAHLVFQARTEITGTTDRCHLEVSPDGARWEKVLKFDGVVDWTTHRLNLSHFQDQKLYLRFNVLTGGQRVGRGIEIAALRLETVPVAAQRPILLKACPGWQAAAEGSASWQARESEVAALSQEFEVTEGTAATVVLESKMASSSAFAEALLEVLDSSDRAVAQLRLDGAADWTQRIIPLPGSAPTGVYRLRLWSRFAARKPEDGFWVRRLTLMTGLPDESKTLWLDGAPEDGIQERKALLALLEQKSATELEKLYRLRAGLPSLQAALALSAVVEEDSQIPALLALFATLGEEAVSAFTMLKDLAQGEDLYLQARVLLASGMQEYPSTRDHLGAGLLPAEEFEAQCRLYLTLRQSWTEEQARKGLSLLLTPIGGEGLATRSDRFLRLLGEHPQPDPLFAAWEKAWN